jgi:hypothetical protein
MAIKQIVEAYLAMLPPGRIASFFGDRRACPLNAAHSAPRAETPEQQRLS